MVEVIRRQGIVALKKTSIPPKISTSNKMYHELFFFIKNLWKNLKRVRITKTYDALENRIG